MQSLLLQNTVFVREQLRAVMKAPVPVPNDVASGELVVLTTERIALWVCPFCVFQASAKTSERAERGLGDHLVFAHRDRCAIVETP